MPLISDQLAKPDDPIFTLVEVYGMARRSRLLVKVEALDGPPTSQRPIELEPFDPLSSVSRS